MIYRFVSALDAVIEQRKHHKREANRLRMLAPNVTTAALKARVLGQAQEHAALAGFDKDPPAPDAQPAR